jgi:phosphatidylinositol 4-kinase
MKMIVKSGDDLRQEQFAMQLIDTMAQIFKVADVGCWLKPYEILATDSDCGIMVCLKDAMSIDAIKKKLPSGMSTLKDYFLYNFGGQRNSLYKRARLNFCKSLAGYSLVCYILQIKDRHSGNIMLDNDGHIIHIDFGFLLSIAPGKGIKFERAPFKFTTEYLEVLGGIQSKVFKQFKKYMAQGFTELQKNADKIIVLVEMMAMGQQDLPCFAGGLETIVKELKQRLFPTGRVLSKQRSREFIDDLVYPSQDNWRTVMYDRIQYCCQFSTSYLFILLQE